MRSIVVIIPAYNEEQSIGKVISDIPKDIVVETIVVNNNSSDSTSDVALKAGATVIDQPLKGYGNACLKGLDYLANKDQRPDIVVFLDGDYSDYPEEMVQVTAPIINDGADLVIGSRVLGNREKGSLTPQQIFGNWLATKLIKVFYRITFSDLGPFRAVKYDKLIQLKMQDKTYGWTVEMQVKAAKMNMKCVEVPVTYRNRIGTSKVSGTLRGTIGAGYKILTTIFKYL